MPDQMRLLLITGAGASTDLSSDPSHPLPLMGDWAERLREKLGGPLSQMACLDAAKDGIEFEETLGALFRWLDTIPLAHRFRRLARAHEDMEESHPGAFANYLHAAERHGVTIRARLHESLFDEFGPDRIDDQKARRAYSRLLARLTDGSVTGGVPKVPLICATTNYDRSLEVVFGPNRRVRTGFEAHQFRTPVLDPRDLGKFEPDSPAVLYLHGAVGWYRRDDGNIISMPADQGYNPTHGSPAVLYPSPDKEIAQAETLALWDEFRQALAQATHVFVLGHGLNDAHLVAAIKESRARIAVTYRADDKGDAKAQRILDLLPNALPVACEFGEKPVIEEPVVDEWRG